MFELELSEESCEEKVAAVLPASCIEQLASSNWKERFAGLEALQKAVEEMEKSKMPCQALVRLLEKDHGWEETKHPVMQKKLHVLTLIARKGNFSRTSAQVILAGLVGHMGDVICSSDAKGALTAIAEACLLPWTAGKVTSLAFSQSHPRTQTETLNWLANAITEFGFTGMQVKPLVSTIIAALAAAHPEVRASAVALVGIVSLYVGPPLRAFFEGETLPLLSQIDAALEKVKGQSPPVPTRGSSKHCRGSGDEGKGGDAQDNGRTKAVDISHRVTPQLVSKIQDKSGRVQKEGLEEMAGILQEARFIQPNLGDLPTALRDCLQDPNTVVVQETLSLLQQLALTMGPSIKQHVKELGLPLIALFRDSKSNVRATALMAINAWAEQIDPKDWLEGEDSSEELNEENSFRRHELRGWLAEKLPVLRSATSDLLLGVPHLYACLGEGNGDVQKAAREALPFFVMHLGVEEMAKAAGQLKPPTKDTVVAILEPVQANPPAKAAGQLKPPTKDTVVAMLEPVQANPPAKAAGQLKPPTKDTVVAMLEPVQANPPAKAAGQLKPPTKDTVVAMLEPVQASPPAKSTVPAKLPSRLPRITAIPAFTSASATSHFASASSSQAAARDSVSSSTRKRKAGPKEAPLGAAARKVESVPEGKVLIKGSLKDGGDKLGPVFIIVPKGKEQRAKDEKGCKVLRWNFPAPSNKYMEQLKAQMCCCVSNWLQEEMFHANFQHHIKALAILVKHLEREKDGVISCLDLILKWLTLRFFDNNTWVLMKSLEYLKLLFALLSREKYQLTENEAASFLPYLVLKLGETKEVFLREVHAVLKRVCLVYPARKMFSFIMEGARSKNAKQQAGCLAELGYLVKAYGMEVCQPSPGKAFKVISAFIDDQNDAIHNAALNVIAAAQSRHGEGVFKVIGNLSEKHMRMLEESMQRAAADRSSASLAQQATEKPPHALRASATVSTGAAEGMPPKPGHSHSTGADTETGQAAPPAFQLDAEGAENVQGSIRSKSPGNEAITQPGVTPERQPRAASLNPPGMPSNVASIINFIIHHVASGDSDTIIQALAQIDEILKQEDKAEAMSGHINQFLIAILRQLRYIHRLQVGEEKLGKDQVIQLYGCIIRNMMLLFQTESLAREASTGVLKELLHSLVTLMLDSQVEDLEEGQEVVQSINLLMKKVLEQSDQTRTFSALLALLQDSLTAAASPPKFPELVAKCLWRITQLLPRTIGTVNLDQILLDLHLFMKALPQGRLKQCASQFPLRALETLLHTLRRLVGPGILEHLTLIEDKEASELEAHLCRVMRLTPLQGATEPDADTGQGVSRTAAKAAKGKVNDTLAAIFKKIGSKENAREGLEELYEYKQKCPSADLEPFLENVSLLFRSYVKHGLAVMGMERAGQQHRPPSTGRPLQAQDPAPTRTASSLIRNTNGEAVEPSLCLDGLKSMRWRCGSTKSCSQLPLPRQPSKPEGPLVLVSPDRPSSKLPRYMKIPRQK